MMSLPSKHINKNHIGLYRDGNLAISKNTSGEKKNKRTQEKFRKIKTCSGHYCAR